MCGANKDIKRFSWSASVVSIAALMLAPLIMPASTHARGDANEGSCPPETEASPGFRTFLPDCRAYEMVTPPFKDGGADTVLHAISSTGTHVIISSFSAFAGTENDPLNNTLGAVYQLVRSGSGWTVSSVTPSASMSPNAHFFGSSSDGASDLWEVVGSAHSIYSGTLDIRESSGAFTEVGTVIPPAAQIGPPATDENGGENPDVEFAGATPDLSHVLFTI